MKTRKKVLLLGKLPPPFMGPSVAFEILIHSGLKDRYELLHLDVKANTSLSTLGKWSFKKLLANIGIYARLFTLLLREKPDLVLVPVSQATIGFIKDSVFILLCALASRKCIIQLRGSDFKRWVSGSPAPVRWYVRYILKLTKGVIVLGNKLRYLFEEFYPDDRIFVVPNGGNFPVQNRGGNTSGPVKIIYLANLQPSKGIEDVLAAFKLVHEQLPGACTLTVIGTWRREDVRQRCLSLVSAHRLPVSFLPPETGRQKFEHLGSSDIFVFTPREPEGHPWVIVEAMASGLPVISTDQGAITESVIDGDNGFIVPPKDPSAIASKLIVLIRDPSLRESMSRRSRELYLEKFTEERMVENFCRVFDNVMARA